MQAIQEEKPCEDDQQTARATSSKRAQQRGKNI